MKNCLLALVTTIVMILPSCKDEDQNEAIFGEIKTEKGKYPAGRPIDMAPFEGLEDQDLLDRLRELSNSFVATRAIVLPSYIDAMYWDDIYEQKIPNTGETRTLTIEGSLIYPMEVRCINMATNELLGTVTTINNLSTAGEVEIAFVFDAFYNTNQLDLRIYQIQYRVPTLDVDWTHIEVFHQYPYPMGFITNLEQYGYMIDQKGESVITIKSLIEDRGTDVYHFYLTVNGTDILGPEAFLYTADSLNIQLPENNTGSPRVFTIEYVVNLLPDRHILERGTQLARSEDVIVVDNYYIANFNASAGTAIVFLKLTDGYDLSGVDPDDETTWPDLKVFTQSAENHKYVQPQVIKTPVKANFKEYTGTPLYDYPVHYDAYAEVPYDAGGPQDGWHYDKWQENLAYKLLAGGVGNWEFYYNNLREDILLGKHQQTPWNLIVENKQTTVENNSWTISLAGRWNPDNLYFRVVDLDNNRTEVVGWKKTDEHSGGDYFNVQITFDNIPANGGGGDRTLGLEYCLNGNITDPNSIFLWTQDLAPCQSWKGSATIIQE